MRSSASGSFLELELKSDQHLPQARKLLRTLGIEEDAALNMTYFELALRSFPSQQLLLSSLHERFGHYAFGISSAVLTTIGIIVGLNAATASRTAVIAGIVGVAVADSLSDALGMYAAKRAERGVSAKAALRSATATLAGKALFTLSFIIPFLFLPFFPSLVVSIAWGLALLAFVNVQIAYVQQSPIVKTVCVHILIALAVIAFSYAAGLLVSAAAS